jgi:hypothetical protein
MTQRQLNRAVARATGERITTIRRMGFGPLAPLPDDDHREPLVLDWDRPDASGGSHFPPPIQQRHTAA